MDEPALRDVERWQYKDKIEVRLDNRQVFFLFFGSALCACMLFVLGVIVGKRLESRGRAAAPEVQDPLAVLDRINSVGLTGGATASASAAAVAGKPVEPALTFPKALIATAPSAPIKALPAALGPSRPVTAASVPKPIVPQAAKPATPVVVARPAAVVAVAKPAVAKAAVATPVAKLPAASINRTLSASVAAPAMAAKPAAPVVTAKPPAAPAPPKGHFTLQLSSFPDKSEAEAYAKRFTAQGAFIVASEIPGKGTWYRVRVGNYGSSQEAIAAKGAFEKQTNTIAYIAGR